VININTDVMFSSKTDDWATPQWLFNELDKEFKFTLDVCASRENSKCPLYFDKQSNGLIREWIGCCWMNPPYGREIGKWVRKAYEESQKACTVVCLLPARTDTKWFHEFIYNKAQIRFLKGRLKFGNSKNPAPFPSMLVVFGGD
jgi:site-specific DNA-methyltransferase (adenine-specific)